jgi:aminobenzoyl-glutamate utilization protein B
MRRIPGVALLLLALSVAAASAQQPSADHRAALLRGIDAKREKYVGVAKEIWGFAEIGYQEQKSSALLQQPLKAAGFQVTAGVAGMPTAFVATFGSGKPVIAGATFVPGVPPHSWQASVCAFWTAAVTRGGL